MWKSVIERVEIFTFFSYVSMSIPFIRYYIIVIQLCEWFTYLSYNLSDKVFNSYIELHGNLLN